MTIVMQPEGLVAFRDCGHFGSELQGNDDQWFAPIAANDQEVVAFKPIIEPAETIASDLDFDAAVDAEQRHRDVTAEASAHRPTKRNAFGRKAAVLQIANDAALCAVPFLS
jgi:hypothetical protein